MSSSQGPAVPAGAAAIEKAAVPAAGLVLEAFVGKGTPAQWFLDSLPRPLWAVDPTGRYSAFNRAHESMVHALYGTRIRIGDPMLDHVRSADDAAMLRVLFDRALGGLTLSEEVALGGTGRGRRFEVTASPIRRRGRRIVGVSLVADDITDHAHATGEMRRLSEELDARVADRLARQEGDSAEFRRLTKARERAIARTADEMRGVLEQMFDAAGVLLSERLGDLSTAQIEQLRAISGSGRSLLRLVASLEGQSQGEDADGAGGAR